MRLSKPQSEVFRDDTRFRVMVAGRRFGKTHLAIVELVRQALIDNKRHCWYVAPTYKAAKQIAWELLKEFLPLEYIDKRNESELSIRLLNGSMISLKGADNPDSLRGVGLNFIVLDEFADMKNTAWTEVLRPTLSDKGGSALFIGSPKGRNHFYDLWTDGVDGREEWTSYQFTTLDGGNVPEKEIESAKRDLDERTFNQEYLAQFVNYSGIIYYNFEREKSVKKSEAHSLMPLHIGVDFNINPMSAVVFIRDKNDLYAVDEIVIHGSNTDEMADEIHHRYPNRPITIYPDPAARQRKTSAGGKTDLSILENAGFTVKVRPAHTPIRDRINAVNSRLKTKSGDRHLIVDPKCKHVIRGLERHTYKEGTSQPDKDSGFDHMNDALGYCVDYLFPVRKESTQRQPTRWT